MQTVAFLNRKGGVGKTSCSHHLAGAFAEAGLKVLLVDADPQSSLSSRALVPAEFESIPPGDTLAGLLSGDPRPLSAFTRPAWPGVDLVVGSPVLDEANVAEPWDLPEVEQGRLADALAESGGGHDLCLIDCPPNLLALSWMALVAADALVVPLQPEDYGAMGLAAVDDFVATVRRSANPGLETLGYLLTMQQARDSGHRAYEAQIREARGDAVFRESIRRRADYRNAISFFKPVTSFRRTSDAAAEIRRVRDELAARLVGLPEAGAGALARGGRGVA